MFTINDDLSIYVTRGDIVHIAVSADSEGEPYIFKVGDIVRFKIFGKKDCADVIFQKDFPVTTAGETVEIFLSTHETRIGGVINKHSDYWYEIELNPESNPQTIIGYDEDGAKIFRLFPEGRNLDKEEPDITPEDVAILDDKLDVTSLRPVENRAIVRGIEATAQRITKELNATITAEVETLNGEIENFRRDVATMGDVVVANNIEINDINTDLNNLKDLVNISYRNEYLGRIQDLGTQIGEINTSLEQIINNPECLYTGSVGGGNTITLENSSKYNVFRVVLDDSFKTSMLLTRSGIGVYAENQMRVLGSLSTTALLGCSMEHEPSYVSVNSYIVGIEVYSLDDGSENWRVYSHFLGRSPSAEVTTVNEMPILEIYGIL